MFFCLRIDVDYVPWDTPDADEYGHGEPALVLRLLEMARGLGYRFHFFASNRVLRAFPATADAILNEGHDLDWYCKHPESGVERLDEAHKLFALQGHQPLGLSVKGAWPAESNLDLSGLKFLTALPSNPPEGLTFFPVETRLDRDASRAGLSTRAWTDATKGQIRDAASRNRDLTVVVRPQVLAKYDPKLVHVRELLEIARAVGLPIMTLRQAL